MEYFNEILGTVVRDSVEIINFFRDVNISDLIEDVHYFDYYMKDGETMETIAQKEYGDKKYWWIIALINEIRDTEYDLPLPDRELRFFYDYCIAEGLSVSLSEMKSNNNEKREIKILKNKYLDDFLYLVKKRVS